MNRRSKFWLWLVLAASIGATVPCPAQSNSGYLPRHPHEQQSAAMREASTAIEALLVRSDLHAARTAATSAINGTWLTGKRSVALQGARLDALFVQMEAAAIQADTRSVLESAISLAELAPSGDARGEIAGARMLDLAANTSEFHAVLPRIQRALITGSKHSAYLRSALIAAAADGLEGISPLKMARDSGLVTNWRVAGPFGLFPNIAFDHQWAPERDTIAEPVYEGRRSEDLEFATGTFELPDYFPASGVFYAASTLSVPAGGNWVLRVESPGTLRVDVDGLNTILKDDRFRSTPEMVWQTVKLRAGQHRILVKFLASAAPFRVALLPATPASGTSPLPSSPALSQYLNAARAYWTGDYGSAIEQLTHARSEHESAAVDVLLAQTWSRVDGSSVERIGLLQSALAAAPEAFAADYELAFKAYSEEHYDDAIVRLRRIVTAQPDFEPAVRLLAKTAAALGWQSEAAGAHVKAAELHPSCAVLHDASEFFDSMSDFANAARVNRGLEHCAPGSLAWADALSNAGQHAESAIAAEKVARELPLDREAQAFLVRELSLAGQPGEAQAAANRLVALAPNSAQFRRTAEALNAGSPFGENVPAAADGFADRRPFYAPYRRDGLAITKQTAERRFSGGPAVLLLNERIAQLRDDGGVSLYVHKITRVLDRDGILIYGEVSIPQGASLIELRTIKADGTVAEPEFNQHKATISMPALSPGDAIDVEYVVRYENAAQNTDAFRFTFGSLAAPMLLSRFVVLTPAGAQVQFAPSGDIPAVRVEERDGLLARVWERNDIPQSTSEVSMPRAGVLPEIRMYPAVESWAGVRDFYRDALIDATRAGSRVAASAELMSGVTDEAKLRSAYRFVTSRIHSIRTDYSTGDFEFAESTLSAYAGSRTAAMLALARAMGIEADVLMTRDAGSPAPQVASPQAYSRPLIVFHYKEGDRTRDVLIDAESDGIGFGGIAAAIERKDALFVPLRERQGDDLRLITAVPTPLLDERSVAEAEVALDENGNLSARVSIRMGAARSAQMRAILGGIEPDGRKHFFEQLAMRIFPGAADATGEVRNENDPDQTLEILLNCRAPHFVNFQGQSADLDQLVPALGLRKMYVPGGPRRAPLYIDTPLFETAVFRVTLPDGVRFAALPGDMTESNEFGSYAVTFRQPSSTNAEVRREFRIPVQVVQPGRFEAFSRFAGRIDEAERQRLLVERKAVSYAGAGR